MTDPTNPADEFIAQACTYCQRCSAAPGTPCSNLFTGRDLDGVHRERIALMHRNFDQLKVSP